MPTPVTLHLVRMGRRHGWRFMQGQREICRSTPTFVTAALAKAHAADFVRAVQSDQFIVYDEGGERKGAEKALFDLVSKATGEQVRDEVIARLRADLDSPYSRAHRKWEEEAFTARVAHRNPPKEPVPEDFSSSAQFAATAQDARDTIERESIRRKS